MKLTVAASLLAIMAQAAEAEVRLAGRVLDENNAAVSGAQVLVRPAGAPAGTRAAKTATDPTGAFTFTTDAPGDYLVSVEREGYFRLQDRPIQLTAGTSEVTLVLNTVRDVYESVDVAYSPPTIDLDTTRTEERLTTAQILDVPYPSTNTLRNVFRILPGVVQDNRGGIHMNGGTEEQILYTLDGFQINDPLTGRFDTRLSVETVKALEVSGMNPAEFGKGSSGTLAIKTATGDDKFRYSGTNFIPGVENRKGLVIGGWTPRFNLSGPILKQRAWFSDGIDIQYDKHVVDELPKGQDRTTSWRFSNLLRSQFNLSPSNILYTSFLGNYWTAPRNGLDKLSPPSTTVDRRSRQWFFNVKDQKYFWGGALFEIGYGANRTFGREIPQGHGILLMTPDGQLGNSFYDATRTAGRDQFIANLFLPSFTRFGGHQVKIGVDFDAVNYWQDVSRTGYEFLRADNSVSRLVTFGGSGRVKLSNTEASAYIQDTWKVRPSVLVEMGLRHDWDRLVGNTNVAPRIGVSWAPPKLRSTKVSGGFGVVYDQTNLRLFSRPLDQYSITTHYDQEGDIAWGPALSIFTLGNGPFRTPHYRNWNAAVEQRFTADLYARFQYIGRRGANGFTYVNTINPNAPASGATIRAYGTHVFDAIYALRNLRRDVYDAFEVTLRQAFRKKYEWMASYTRSRALSNGVVDINVDDPLLVTDNVGRMPWDAPNRFLSWGYLPTFSKVWAVAYLLETRNGFPFGVTDESGLIRGTVDSRRFPIFFELNLHLERLFQFRNNYWGFRFGFTNITNHRNYNVVNNDISSPHFLEFYGGQSRALVFRIRWIGKVERREPRP